MRGMMLTLLYSELSWAGFWLLLLCGLLILLHRPDLDHRGPSVAYLVE